MSNVDGTTNPADVQTKNVSRGTAERHTQAISCEFIDGRATGAGHLHSIRRQIRQARFELKALQARAGAHRPIRSKQTVLRQSIDSARREAEVCERVYLAVEIELHRANVEREASQIESL